MTKTILLLLIALSSCAPTKAPQDNPSITAPTEQIVFLNLKIQKAPNGNKITLLSKTKTTGKIKQNPQKPRSQEYLTIEVFNNNTLYQTTYNTHPLYKNIEYADEQNQLTTKSIQLDQDEFFIRLQTKSGQTKVRIYETLKDKPKTELITLTL